MSGEYVFVRRPSVSGVLPIEQMVNARVSHLLRHAIEAGWPRRGTRLGAEHESAAPRSGGRQTSTKKLQQGVSQRSSSKSMSDEDAGKVFVEPQLKIFEISFGSQGGGVEFLQCFGDAFGLRA
jgi:hypothetical protein